MPKQGCEFLVGTNLISVNQLGLQSGKIECASWRIELTLLVVKDMLLNIYYISMKKQVSERFTFFLFWSVLE